MLCVGPTVHIAALFHLQPHPHLPLGEGGDGMAKFPYLDTMVETMTVKAAGRHQGSQHAGECSIIA